MEYVQPEFYDKFKCIGGICEDSCCIGWEVEVDEDTYEYYTNVKGEFGDRLKKNMADDDEKSFVIKKNGRCPFLNDENLCDIYTELGEEHLCSVCTDFPRIFAQIGDYKQVVVSVSCMEVGRIVFGDIKPIKFTVRKDDELPDEDISNEDKIMFDNLRYIRKNAIDIMQTRKVKDNNISWKLRAACVLDYMEKVQNCWNLSKEEEAICICPNENVNEYVINWLNENSGVDDRIDLQSSCLLMLDSLDNLIPINKTWKSEYKHTKRVMRRYYSEDKWNKFEKDLRDSFDVWFEHLMVYYIFRYLVLSLYDNNLLTKIKLAVSSCIMIECMDYARWIKNDYKYCTADRVDVAHIYSREVEHSEDNLEILTEEIMFGDVYSVTSLNKILLQ